MKVAAPANPVERMSSFAESFMRAPPGTELSILCGISSTGQPALGIKMGGVVHPFTAEEARVMALEQTLNAMPDNPVVRNLPDLILHIRHAADVVERKESKR